MNSLIHVGSAFRRTVLAVAISAAAWWLASVQPLESHGTLTTTVLFDREVVRILNSRCVMCHSEGAISFPLSTYEETWVQGRAVRAAAIRRHMPPWAAVPGYGRFANDNSLTLRELQFLVSWVEGLGPRNAGTVFLNVGGAGAAPSEVRAEAHAGHWQLGEPAVTRELEPQTIEAGAGDIMRRTVVDLGLDRERRVRALEFLPNDRRVLRAAAFTLESTGQWLASWTPWYGFVSLPAGVSYRLPAGSRIVAEMHYRGAAGRIEAGGRLGLHFSEEPGRPASDVVLESGRAPVRVAADTLVWALQPAAERGVTSIEVKARRPDGGTDVLLFARELPAAWPTPYILTDPYLARRGTELSVIARRGSGAASEIVPARVAVSRY